MAMRGYDDNGLVPPTPDRVDGALGTLWRMLETDRRPSRTIKVGD